MTSLKGMVNCIGLSGRVSIVRGFYGYRKAPTPLSLTKQVRLLKGSYIDVNMIRVGIESFTPENEEVIDASVQRVRDIYATVGIGVGRVRHFGIATQDADGKDKIDSREEAKALTEDWTVDNSAIDVFIVRAFVGALGLSHTPGPCDKDSKTMSGVVVTIQSATVYMGNTLGHELGHYLGLDEDFEDNHNPDQSNLMFADVVNGGRLTPGQGGVMRLHCKMRSGCSS